jgi:hypothetical protein
MIAAQLVASHNAAMECYRRAMLPEKTFEGRRDRRRLPIDVAAGRLRLRSPNFIAAVCVDVVLKSGGAGKAVSERIGSSVNAAVLRG